MEIKQKSELEFIIVMASLMSLVALSIDALLPAIADISKQLQLPKKIVAKMAKVYFKQNYDEEVAVQDQFETLYETIVK